MDKEKILSRLNQKDYTNVLESILEKKDFSEQIKNLLLSMLYKIEAGYQDYVLVKREVEDKKEYIESILSIIDEKCKKIELVKEESSQAKQMEESGKQYYIDALEKTIYIVYPNEKNLLYSLYELDDRQVYLDEKYNAIRVSLSELLNLGENMNHTEVLRDFNGWSWSVGIDEMPNLKVNLIYQDLIYLLGSNFIKEWVHTNEVKDYVQLTKEKLTYFYGEELAKKVLENVYALSIMLCVQTNEKEKKRLLEEKEELQKELERLEDKTKLLNEISEGKKEAFRKIREIDSIINDKRRLEEEYIARNEKLPEYNKIFSLSHLTEILTRQRKKIMTNMEESNKILEPNYYIQVKGKLEKEIALLEYANANPKEENKQIKLFIQLQQLVLDCFLSKVEQIKEKEEIVDAIYRMRYYNLLYLTKEIQIKDVKELVKKRNVIMCKILEKGQEQKVITKLSKDQNLEKIVLERLVEMRLINLGNTTIEIVEQAGLQVQIYDTDVLETTIEIAQIATEDLLIKQAKRYKLFS